MMNIKKDDGEETVTMLLTLEYHRHEPLAFRALKIRKCAKIIYKRTNSKVLKDAMHTIRNSKDDQGIVNAIELVNTNWNNL